MNTVLIAGGVVSAVGLIFGILLGVAAKIFAVEQDEKLPLILEVLPGANCGGCGFAGCSQFAGAVISGEAAAGGCPVGGVDAARGVAKIMGITLDNFEKKVAFVRCAGSEGVAEVKYSYEGNMDCYSASKMAGGEKACQYSCIGYGTCISACNFGAISIKDDLAVIDFERCTGCGQCVSACPKNVISIISKQDKYIVKCQNQDKANVIKFKCTAGCIGCKICEKVCPVSAVHVDNFLATIDKDLCISCGQCAEKCPKKIIRKVTV